MRLDFDKEIWLQFALGVLTVILAVIAFVIQKGLSRISKFMICTIAAVGVLVAAIPFVELSRDTRAVDLAENLHLVDPSTRVPQDTACHGTGKIPSGYAILVYSQRLDADGAPLENAGYLLVGKASRESSNGWITPNIHLTSDHFKVSAVLASKELADYLTSEIVVRDESQDTNEGQPGQHEVKPYWVSKTLVPGEAINPTIILRRNNSA